MTRKGFIAILVLTVLLVGLISAMTLLTTDKPAPTSARNSAPNQQPKDVGNEAAAKPTCDKSLQSLVDAASPGISVVVPGGCIYRETVIVDKPLILKAAPGAEIRGSDVWTGWQRSGDHWVKGTLPSFSAGDNLKCAPGTERCRWPEQVYLDLEPLEQVAFDPKSGQFSIDAAGNVVLADDPAGHVVEVATRKQWMVGRSANVTIQGFTMRHAANARDQGAITNRDDRGGNYHPGWTIEGNTLSDAHAAVVRIGGKNLTVLRNDISRGGQLGIHGTGERILVQDNKIHHNNTEDFDPFWEAGGMKWVHNVSDLTVDKNEVFENQGVGVWCDIDCADVVYSDNRVRHNSLAGLHFEISSGAQIFGNVVWNNGWGYHANAPAWSAGIKVDCSKNVEVYDNVLAWNAGGITVLHYVRSEPRWNVVENVHVHNNTIVAGDGPSLSWLQADGWPEGMMTDPTANNRGEDNRYWYATSESSVDRFRWGTIRLGKLAQFNTTPGEEAGRYMTDSEKDRIASPWLH